MTPVVVVPSLGSGRRLILLAYIEAAVNAAENVIVDSEISQCQEVEEIYALNN